MRFSNGDQNRLNRKIRNCSPIEFCIKQYRNSQLKWSALWTSETLGALLLRNPGDSLSQSIRLHKTLAFHRKYKTQNQCFVLCQFKINIINVPSNLLLSQFKFVNQEQERLLIKSMSIIPLVYYFAEHDCFHLSKKSF